ncbi:hypothetical protein SLEP1_g28320 [Rubroshorea leprosula]|uniref:Uncharacterized protein n=1 Tax=Rubroshorea leprosula TaxID=152421 RepID=A0AAV5K4R4_9ROSI|nr:hypothetical protein SLEP1_g28320 [Rubroshorea leprosula]
MLIAPPTVGLHSPISFFSTQSSPLTMLRFRPPKFREIDSRRRLIHALELLISTRTRW